MGKMALGFSVALMMSGHGFAQQAGESQAAPGPVTVFVGRDMSYVDATSISRAVLAECQLPQQGAQLLHSAMREAGFQPVVDDQAMQAGKGRVLLVQISNAVAAGNAFIGHRKMVEVKGRLLEDGKEVATFAGMRSSMGGAFGGFKGSCSVLGRCLETLAKDISGWMKNPVTGRIGE
jgi:hypothetical protein